MCNIAIYHIYFNMSAVQETIVNVVQAILNILNVLT